jgi:hypothetical protein
LKPAAGSRLGQEGRSTGRECIEAPPSVRMARRIYLVIRKVSTEIFVFEEIVTKADRRPVGQRFTPHLGVQ